jgi:hypothetical protein
LPLWVTVDISDAAISDIALYIREAYHTMHGGPYESSLLCQISLYIRWGALHLIDVSRVQMAMGSNCHGALRCQEWFL